MNNNWKMYLAICEAKRRLNRNVSTPFEVANMAEWHERLAACKSLRAVNHLMSEFETADKD